MQLRQQALGESPVVTRLDYQNKAAARRERHGLSVAMFGLPITELLQLLASEVGGVYDTGKLFEGEHLDVTVGNWPLVVDYTVSAKSWATRVRCNFLNSDGFRFSGSRNDLIHRWLRLPRWPTLRTGSRLIDDSLLIEGSDAAKLQAVFYDQHVLSCLEAQPPGWVDFTVAYPSAGRRAAGNVVQLRVVLQTQVKHSGHLRQLLQFSAVLLDRLAAIGSALPCPIPTGRPIIPGVRL